MTSDLPGKGPSALSDFAGCWRLFRRIDDHAAGKTGRMEGHALFLEAGGGLVCDEMGTLIYAGHAAMEARRRYLWRASGVGRIAVFFADERPFHAFALGPEAAARHHCAPDVYDVRYDFRFWPRWRAVWTVSGPRKSYVSTTDYTPDAAG